MANWNWNNYSKWDKEIVDDQQKGTTKKQNTKQVIKNLPFSINKGVQSAVYFGADNKFVTKIKQSQEQMLFVSSVQIPQDGKAYLLKFRIKRLNGPFLLGIMLQEHLNKYTLQNEKGCILFEFSSRKSYQNGECARIMTHQCREVAITENTIIQMEVNIFEGVIGFYNSANQCLGQSLISETFLASKQRIYPFAMLRQIGDTIELI